VPVKLTAVWNIDADSLMSVTPHSGIQGWVFYFCDFPFQRSTIITIIIKTTL